MQKVPLRPHQQEALNKLKDGCILWGGVGSGKSRVALAYYLRTDPKIDVIVITTAKKRDTLDWEKEAAKFVIGKERDATTAGILTVDSWNNLHKYEKVENTFFIFDEQRLVGGGRWSKAFIKIARNNRWILLSATPGDTWLDYISVFVANGFYKNRTEFKREHVIYNSYAKFPKVERYVNVQRLVRYRFKILIKMPYEKETVRHEVNVWTEYDDEKMKQVLVRRWNIFDSKPIRDIAEVFYLMRRVTNSDPSRLAKLRQLMQDHPKLIVFYNFNYELEILRELKEEIIFAEWNGHKHEELPQGDKWVYVVQYIAGSEGWNCVTTDSMVFWSLTYSYKMWEQAHGRIDRLNTKFTNLNYFYLRSKAPIDLAIWKSLKAKRSFQEVKHRSKFENPGAVEGSKSP